MTSVQDDLRGGDTSKRKSGLIAGLVILTISMMASAGTTAAPDSHNTKTKHWYEIGKASWYGPHFQGKKTANGEAFDMNSLTCAHRNLPLGSWVRVTNLRNRKSIFVRVNDRGPMPTDRIIDLSYAAAQAVGIEGLAKVKLEVLHSGDMEMAQALLAQLSLPQPLNVGM
jgi:rare lipoprotein A